MLPKGLIERLTNATPTRPDIFALGWGELFAWKSERGGGVFATEPIAWFNGSHFDGADVIMLVPPEIDVQRKVARLDWS